MICVKMLDGHVLRLIAKDKNKKILGHKDVKENVDFKWNNGKLVLFDNLNVVTNTIGMSKDEGEIGLDKNSNLKYVYSGGGVVVFPIPIIMVGSDTYRFERIID